eukprot:9397325-Pyramimonas_sp.AAC.1
MKVFVFVGGDFNFADELPQALNSYDPPPAPPTSSELRSSGQWKVVLKRMVEIETCQHTHHCKAQGT